MNYYLAGIDGMPRLLENCKEPLPHLKKNVYPDAFRKFYKQNEATFYAIEQVYHTVIDKEQCLENMANALTEYAVELVNACKRKSEREHVLMDLNMAMAVFVIPMVLAYKGDSSKLLADKLLASWKTAFPKSNIKAAEFEFVEAGFHKKFCYITTAVCESLGKADDCYELTLLRDYRDRYLASIPEGEALIQEYYDVAPSIVKHIGQQDFAPVIYRSIWEQYIHPCITMIERGQMEECRQLYKTMLHNLKNEYFLSRV